MAAFTFFIKEHFNPIAETVTGAVWHADIGLQRTFDGASRQMARITDFASAILPPLKSKFCDLQAFKNKVFTRFMQDAEPQPLFVSNDDAVPKAAAKRNLFQPYRFQ